MLDYIRIACAVPPVALAQPRENGKHICRYIRLANDRRADVVVFPELALTGYACRDLFFQQVLHKTVGAALEEILQCSRENPKITAVVGLPLPLKNGIYNCAAVICAGKIHGLVPKTYLPNHNEFSEQRWFISAETLEENVCDLSCLGLKGSVPIAENMVFTLAEGAKLGVEICEDLWSPLPPSVQLSLAGAEVIVNPSASNEAVGKRALRRDLVRRQSASCGCIYAFCSTGSDETSQDFVFSGHSLICENGKVLAENACSVDADYLLVQDCDLGKIRSERWKNTTFSHTAARYGFRSTSVKVSEDAALQSDGGLYPICKQPFVPEDEKILRERCREVFDIQVTALQHRLSKLNAQAVVGISGGLDSTLALLVAVEAMRRLGKPASCVHGITMPCFGTTDRTYGNAMRLMRLLGVTAKEIPIAQGVNLHFAQLGHDPSVHNTTYENTQARYRTQMLMDYAGMVGGIVVGTGDLSELALGWCTYNGDHMSMYGVNAGVPKTLIGPMLQQLSRLPQFVCAEQVLQDIVSTPISPELLPPDASGNICQQTEDLVGPYILHDFFLYYILRFGFTPGKIYALACRAFAGDYAAEEIKKWLKLCYHRFFTQQFKRNCVPDGVKIGSVSLNPRGDFRMPSDASAQIWLAELEEL